MRILLLGGGGREHALGWKLAASPAVAELISAPGNPGLAGVGRTIPSLDIEDPAEVSGAAAALEVDLLVVGPEGPLAAGVADAVREKGIAVFGPGTAGARLEASKGYAKGLMRKAGVPTARSWTFSTVHEVHGHIDRHPGPYVVKADGLAGGKGVLVTADRIAAKGWATALLEGRFGMAGRLVVIEEHLEGDEVSVIFVVDGSRAIPLVTARDYKRLRDGGQGPNTGGMGCYAPVDDLPAGLVEETRRTAVMPILEVLEEDGIDYRGFLYCGLMLTADGPKVLEYNCRLGDPETQAVLPLLEDDLAVILSDAAHGVLPGSTPTWSNDTAVDVVLASRGYPERPEKGHPISGVDEVAGLDGVHVFHAGTRREGDGLVTAGGRVLNVVGVGPDREAARDRAYAAAAMIRFDGIHYRHDIAQ